MSFLGINLAPIGKKLNEIEGDIGAFFGGGQPAAPPPPVPLPNRQAAASIGSSAGLGPTPGLNPLGAPAIAPPKPTVAIKKPSVAAQILNSPSNPLPTVGRVIAPVGQAISDATGAVEAGANKFDHNLTLPVIGNVADTVGGFIQSPAQTLVHGGEAFQGKNPNAGQTPAQAAGQNITDALNVATAGGGAAILDRAGQAVAAPIVKKLGGNAAAKAAGRFVGTTVAATPLTAAYGAAGDPTNPVAGAIAGAEAGPVIGGLHAAVPLVAHGATVAVPALRASLKDESGGIAVPGNGKKPSVAQSPADKPAILYRGEGTTKGGGQAMLGKGLYLGDENLAKVYTPDGAKPAAYSISPNAKIVDSQAPEYQSVMKRSYKEAPQPGGAQTNERAREAWIATEMQKQGIDGVTRQTPSGAETVLYNSNHATKITPKPTVKLVQTPAGTVKVAEPWGANEPAGTVDVPPPAKPFDEKARQATGNANPIKTELPEIVPGDHAGAIVNSQRAADLVDKSAKQALGSMRALSPDDQVLLPRAIEHPELVKTAQDPVKLAQAIADDKVLHDTTHSVNMAVKGEPTAYRNNHALHDWQLPEDMQTSGDTFKAVNEQARIHPTIEAGEKAGLQLNDRGYVKATAEYAQKASNILRQQALVKGITEADAGAETPRSFELGGGRSMPVSKEAKKALQGSERAPENNAVVKGYDKTVSTLKKTLLSLTQFHPLNISRKAGAAMTLAGHPLNAAKGVTDAFRSISKHYSDTVQRSAQADGTFDDAARIGTPIGTGNDFTVSGGFNPGKHGIGERTIFEQQLPALHIQMVKSIVSDLKKRGVSLDSLEARQAGTRVNEIMGYVNKEVRGLSAPRQRFLSRILLAPQFTRSKWATLKGIAADQGLARRYAIAAVLGDTAAVYAAQTAVGYLSGQKEDNWRDTLLRALIHPSIVTPFKDAKGNNLEIDLPSTYISEAFGLLGNLDRGSNGRLNVNVNPTNIPGNVTNYGRARLNVPASAALKLATNTDYAGKQLYDPAASTGNRVKQAAENIGAGILPIGVQPIVKPGGGVNPLEASAISALGGSLRTDKTTGKGLDTTQYYNAINTAKLGANQDDAATINKYVSRQTDPSTGIPVSSGVVGGHDNATMLLDNAQKGGNALKSLYDNLSKTNNPDPLWKLPLTAPKGQPSVTAYLQYQAQYEGPEKTGTKQLLEGADAAANQTGWLDKLSADRTNFYNNLGPSTSKSTSTEPAYPTIAAPVQTNIDAYNKLPDNQKSSYLQAHPEVTDAFANEAAWTNKIRAIEHAPQLPTDQQPSPQLQQILNTYNALPASKASGNTGADSGARSAWIKANPTAYSQMSDYLAQTSLNSLTKNAVESLYAGQNSQTYLKDIKNVGTYDITQAPGANGTNTYGILGAQGNPTGVAGTSSGAESAAGSGKSYAKLKKVKLYTGDSDSGRRLSKAKFRSGKGIKFAVAGKSKSSKPKVSLKPSLV